MQHKHATAEPQSDPLNPLAVGAVGALGAGGHVAASKLHGFGSKTQGSLDGMRRLLDIDPSLAERHVDEFAKQTPSWFADLAGRRYDLMPGYSFGAKLRDAIASGNYKAHLVSQLRDGLTHSSDVAGVLKHLGRAGKVALPAAAGADILRRIIAATNAGQDGAQKSAATQERMDPRNAALIGALLGPIGAGVHGYRSGGADQAIVSGGATFAGGMLAALLGKALGFHGLSSLIPTAAGGAVGATQAANYFNEFVNRDGASAQKSAATISPEEVRRRRKKVTLLMSILKGAVGGGALGVGGGFATNARDAMQASERGLPAPTESDAVKNLIAKGGLGVLIGGGLGAGIGAARNAATDYLDLDPMLPSLRSERVER